MLFPTNRARGTLKIRQSNKADVTAKTNLSGTQYHLLRLFILFVLNVKEPI